MFKNILLATDGSAASEQAVAMAVGLARTHQARLVAVYVVDPYPYLGIGDTNLAGFNAYMAAAQEHAAQAHAEVAQRCAEGGAAVDLDVVLVEEAGVTAGILATARQRGSDLIVIGSHGRSGVDRIVLGSVAAKVVAQSAVPVLVVRGAHTP
jgi:nucleotide-binding universal stress UspA family protein